MLESECQAIGYDLSKVAGYDPHVVIGSPGWVIIKHFLMQMTHASQFKKLQDKLSQTGRKMTKNRMKALAAASDGWPAQ